MPLFHDSTYKDSQLVGAVGVSNQTLIPVAQVVAIMNQHANRHTNGPTHSRLLLSKRSYRSSPV